MLDGQRWSAPPGKCSNFVFRGWASGNGFAAEHLQGPGTPAVGKRAEKQGLEIRLVLFPGCKREPSKDVAGVSPLVLS